MAQAKKPVGLYTRGIVLTLIMILAIYLIFTNLDIFGNILVVGLGFGAVIMIHEFGHFIVARLSGIKIDQFAIGFPPVLFGLRKTGDGWKIRVLPKFFPKENDPTGEGAISCTIGSGKDPSETEYRIGLIPFGGYVKMLGQEDVGTAEATTDPKSFLNKSLLTRCAVVAAGVVFNAISAVLFFMIAFMIGVKLPAPIVGDVVPNSPAAVAGIKAGDRILAVGRETDIDFTNIALAAALSDVNEKVPLKVRHLDGTEEFIRVAAAKLPNSPPQIPRSFGIVQGQSLTFGKTKDLDSNDIKDAEKLGIKPNDTIVAVNGKPVQAWHQFNEAIADDLSESVMLTIERIENGSARRMDVNVPLEMQFALTMDGSQKNLANIATMVPPMKIASVPSQGKIEKLISRLLGSQAKGPALKVDDIIIGVGDINYPSYAELRQEVKKHNGQELALRVLRKSVSQEKILSEILTVKTYPKAADPRDPNTTVIGIIPMPVLDYPYLATTIDTPAVKALDIPRGATITSLGQVPVHNWRQIIAGLKADAGKDTQIGYTSLDGKTGQVALHIPADPNFAMAVSALDITLPVKDLRETYKAENPFIAVKMGYDKTIMFIAQTYVTLKGLFVGLISPKALMGPAGILKVSYMIVSEHMWTFYIYFIGLISASIAVMNFLPFPILDGGVIMLMIIEKLKGSPIDPKTQGIISYLGLVLIIAFFLYVTWNDITNVFLK